MKSPSLALASSGFLFVTAAVAAERSVSRFVRNGSLSSAMPKTSFVRAPSSAAGDAVPSAPPLPPKPLAVQVTDIPAAAKVRLDAGPQVRAALGTRRDAASTTKLTQPLALLLAAS